MAEPRMLKHRSQGDAWRIRTSLLTTMPFLRHSEGAEMCAHKLLSVVHLGQSMTLYNVWSYDIICEMLSLSPSQIFQNLVQPRPINYTLFWSLLMEASVDFGLEGSKVASSSASLRIHQGDLFTAVKRLGLWRLQTWQTLLGLCSLVVVCSRVKH